MMKSWLDEDESAITICDLDGVIVHEFQNGLDGAVFFNDEIQLIGLGFIIYAICSALQISISRNADISICFKRHDHFIAPIRPFPHSNEGRNAGCIDRGGSGGWKGGRNWGGASAGRGREKDQNANKQDVDRAAYLDGHEEPPKNFHNYTLKQMVTQ